MKIVNALTINSKIAILTLFVLFALSLFPLQGQEINYDYFYRIYFRDKGENHISDFKPSELFSQRALERREKNGILGLDLKDIPVSKEYLDIISSLGLKLHCTSRWINTALFKSAEPVDIYSLLMLPFVNEVKAVMNPVAKGESRNKFENRISENPDLYKYNNQILMINGDAVQNSGFDGSGKMIAVMDGGFLNFDKLPAFENLTGRNGVIASYDFVEKNINVYDYHTHGSDVMCILAGEIQNQIAGTATGAEYFLFRTENTFYEFPVEQDFWAAAAEFADSAGCDIITSSLGYYRFDDPSMDYKYYDMDGKTAFITLAAEAAVSRGIVVVNSAGNEGANTWKYIMAPSDGANVIAVGAVDWRRGRALFSSQGPSSDGRIKPDVMAQGVYLPVQEIDVWDGLYYPSTFMVSGTSFSCPVISGMIACLMQAVPEAKVSDIISTLRAVSDRYNNPDSLYGYGIPDFAKAVTILQRKYIPEPNGDIAVGPNPFKDRLKIFFKDSPGSLTIELLDSSGNPLSIRNYPNYISLSFEIGALQNMKPGLYFLRLTTSRYKKTFKLIKVIS